MWALTFIIRIFVNDTIAIAVWTSLDTTIAVWISFHLCVPRSAASPHSKPQRLGESCAGLGISPLSAWAIGRLVLARLSHRPIWRLANNKARELRWIMQKKIS